eukprot:SAG31_NODE_7585_length_1647_cov_1.885659_2_plen_170_part_00
MGILLLGHVTFYSNQPINPNVDLRTRWHDSFGMCAPGASVTWTQAQDQLADLLDSVPLDRQEAVADCWCGTDGSRKPSTACRSLHVDPRLLRLSACWTQESALNGKRSGSKPYRFAATDGSPASNGSSWAHDAHSFAKNNKGPRIERAGNGPYLGLMTYLFPERVLPVS